MSDMYSQVLVPQETVTDDDYLLTKCSVAEGQRVVAGETVAVVESSKAVFDIESPAEGCVHFHLAAGDQFTAEQPIATICADAQALSALCESSAGGKGSGSAPSEEEGTASTHFSKKALELIERHSLDKAEFSDRALVRERDVKEYLNAKGHEG